jgi:hypothetical protein
LHALEFLIIFFLEYAIMWPDSCTICISSRRSNCLLMSFCKRVWKISTEIYFYSGMFFIYCQQWKLITVHVNKCGHSWPQNPLFNPGTSCCNSFPTKFQIPKSCYLTLCLLTVSPSCLIPCDTKGYGLNTRNHIVHVLDNSN